ncbi:MAG: GDSL-type esterase/lipase family protein [archaeon]
MSVKLLGTVLIIVNLLACCSVVAVVFARTHHKETLVIRPFYVPLSNCLEPDFEASEVIDGRVIHYAVNSDGFRDKNYTVGRPAGKERIIVLGDSYTFGLGVHSNETFPKILESRLGHRYEVLNFGVTGYDTEEEVTMLESVGLKYNPDLVVVAFLTNDVTNHTFLKSKYSELSGKFSKPLWLRRGTDASTLSLEITDKIWGAVNGAWDKKMASMTYDEQLGPVKNALEQLEVLATANKFGVIIYIIQDNPEYTSRLEGICTGMRWRCLVFDNHGLENGLSLSNYHPSPLMHQMMADQLYHFMINDTAANNPT